MVGDMDISHPVAGNRCVIAHIRQLVREEFHLECLGTHSGIGTDPLEGEGELLLRLKTVLRPFVRRSRVTGPVAPTMQANSQSAASLRTAA